MTAVRLTETGPGVSVALTGDEARAVAAAGVVNLGPGAVAGQWVLRGRGKVGVARVGGVELWIEPKVAVARLLFLLGYAHDPRFWRDDPVPLAVVSDLAAAFAGALWRQATRALAAGVLHGYRSMDESSPVLRGRLRETDQLGRHQGRPLPLETRHDELTTDIAENQILATAAARMLRVPRVDEQSRSALRHLLGNLAGVSQLAPGAGVPAWFATRLNARYHTALRLAELVLAATSVEALAGDVLSNAFLIDMPTLFQDFLTVAVREAVVARHGGAVLGQRPRFFDQACRLAIFPDIVWVRDNRVRAVVDAKYTTHTPVEDLYQMLAYCTVLGLRHGHLVYLAEAGVPTSHVVRNTTTEIICHGVDLAQPSSALLGDVDRIVGQIVDTP